MESLPPEILSHVVETFLNEDSWVESWGTEATGWELTGSKKQVFRGQLAHYGAISRAWKRSIERLTFRKLTIRTDEFDDFASLFSGENITRRAYLTTLTVEFILPNPSNPLGCCAVVSIPDRDADSIAFSASVAKLFTILADLATRTIDASPLSLSFYSAYRLSKFEETNIFVKGPCRPPGAYYSLHERREVLEAKAVSGEFELVHEECVPSVKGVKTFKYIGYEDLLDLTPTWIPKIAERLPDLKILRIGMEDLYEAGCVKRQVRRERFATSMLGLMGSHLRNIQLDIRHLSMKNEKLPVQKLVDNGHWDKETWFRILNHLASFPNLAILRFLGGLVICPEFFSTIINHHGTPYPSLVEFELQFAVETADGRWFYERDDETLEQSRSDPRYKKFWRENDQYAEDDDDDDASSLDSEDHVRVFEDEPFRTKVAYQNRFRSAPNPTTFLPFLMDASRAVTSIPTLRKFILKLGNDNAEAKDLEYFPIVSRVFEIWYLKAGMPRSPKWPPWVPNPLVLQDADYLKRNRLYWRVDHWKPWDEIQTAFGDIAGPDAKIVVLDEDQWTYQGGNTSLRVYKGVF